MWFSDLSSQVDTLLGSPSPKTVSELKEPILDLVSEVISEGAGDLSGRVWAAFLKEIPPRVYKTVKKETKQQKVQAANKQSKQ